MTLQKFIPKKRRGRPVKPRNQFVIQIRDENEEALYKIISASLPRRSGYKIVNLIATVEYTNTLSKDGGSHV